MNIKQKLSKTFFKTMPQAVLASLFATSVAMATPGDTATDKEGFVALEGVHFSRIAPMEQTSVNNVTEYYDYYCVHCANMAIYLDSEDGKKVTQQWDYRESHIANDTTWNTYAGFYVLGVEDTIGKEYLVAINKGDFALRHAEAFVVKNGIDWDSYKVAALAGHDAVDDYFAIRNQDAHAFEDRLKDEVTRIFVEEKGLDWDAFQKAKNNPKVLKKKAWVKQATEGNPNAATPMFIVSGKYQILDNWKYEEIANYLIKNQP